ncbi:MAG: agmatinase [Ignisphaera sp.]
MRNIYLGSISESNAFLGFNKQLEETPFIVVGAPLDMSTSYRGGCSRAPKALREASKSLELCTAFSNIDLEQVGFHDLGDIVLAPGDILQSLARIENVIYEILGYNKIVFILGGEHTITLPAFKAFSKRFQNPCLIVFDAHADLRHEYLGSRYNHATVIKRISEETQYKKIVVVGARAISREEIEQVKSMYGRISVIRVVGSAQNDFVERLEREVKVCENSPKYLSIDIDFIDPSYAPGVQTPEPLGSTPTDLLNAISRIVDEKLLAIDIVEITPKYDPSEITAFLGAKIVVEIAGIIARRLKVGNGCW